MMWCRRASLVGWMAAIGCTIDLSLPSNAWAQKAGWSLQADPPAVAVEWPATLKINIAQPPQQEELLFPRQNSVFCVAGLAAHENSKAELWNLATGKRVGAMKGNLPRTNVRAVSADGKYFALAILVRDRTNDVEVWSLETGKLVSQFQADDRALPMTVLDFSAPDEVLTSTFGQVGGKTVNHLRIWDVKTGMPKRQMDIDIHISGNGRYDISPGYRWFATIVGSNDIDFLDLQTGKVIGSIAPPKRTSEDNTALPKAVRFSHDGKEVAVLCQGLQGDVLVTYDLATGNELFRHELPQTMKASLDNPALYGGPAIDFIAKPAGFLWYGSVFIERESGLTLWTFQQGVLETNKWNRIPTPAGLIVSTASSNSRKLQTLEFPAAAMEKSMGAYRNDAPAILKRGDKVQVKVIVGEVKRVSPDEARKSIEDVLALRLANDGLEVGTTGGTQITLKYKEIAGNTLQDLKAAITRGIPLSRVIQNAAGEVEIDWSTTDGKTKLYEHKFNLYPYVLMLKGDYLPTDASVRHQDFEVLKLQLAGLPMPYFVPTDNSLVSLPATTVSSAVNPISPQGTAKKKIEAKNKLGKK